MEKSNTILERIDFEKIYGELQKRKAKLIGIQLPNGLKFFTRSIAERFERKGYEVVISGSPSYGACDIDLRLLNEVDVLVHFAHHPIKALKGVIFAPYYYEYSLDPRWIERIEEGEITLAGTAHYAWKFPEVRKVLESGGLKVHLGRPKGRIKIPGQVLGCNYSALGKAEAILFIVDGEFHAKGAAIYTGKTVYFLNPLTNEFKVFGKEVINEFFKKRYLRISRAIEEVERGVGILVSSKIGQNRMSMAKKLRKKAREKGIMADTLYFDEITPEGLANFPFGVYVNTACPRLTYDDPERFEKSILSPQEFEILLGERKWEEYEIDEMG